MSTTELFALGFCASSVFHFVLWLIERRLNQKHRRKMADLDVKLHAEMDRSRKLEDESWRLAKMGVLRRGCHVDACDLRPNMMGLCPRHYREASNAEFLREEGKIP